MFKILLIIIAIICVLTNVQGSGDGVFAAFDAEAPSSTQAATGQGLDDDIQAFFGDAKENNQQYDINHTVLELGPCDVSFNVNAEFQFPVLLASGPNYKERADGVKYVDYDKMLFDKSYKLNKGAIFIGLTFYDRNLGPSTSLMDSLRDSKNFNNRAYDIVIDNQMGIIGKISENGKEKFNICYILPLTDKSIMCTIGSDYPWPQTKMLVDTFHVVLVGVPPI
jgi:hypothetical protein